MIPDPIELLESRQDALAHEWQDAQRGVPEGSFRCPYCSRVFQGEPIQVSAAPDSPVCCYDCLSDNAKRAYDETMKREPGPELNMEVAQKVMGWRLCNRRAMGWGNGPPVFETNEDPNDPNSSPTRQGWDPSTDISAAWEIVERLREDGWAVDIMSWELIKPGELETARIWKCRLSRGDTMLRNEAPTAPLAICLAALKAAEKGE